mmetsp:Transcript_43117/g.108374  ORF Transcript_43117/g.108374 Transcript_43117/m.108374 type:complete len:379 (+) Transcript_43117:642-1778(+)
MRRTGLSELPRAHRGHLHQHQLRLDHGAVDADGARGLRPQRDARGGRLSVTLRRGLPLPRGCRLGADRVCHRHWGPYRSQPYRQRRRRWRSRSGRSRCRLGDSVGILAGGHGGVSGARPARDCRLQANRAGFDHHPGCKGLLGFDLLELAFRLRQYGAQWVLPGHTELWPGAAVDGAVEGSLVRHLGGGQPARSDLPGLGQRGLHLRLLRLQRRRCLPLASDQPRAQAPLPARHPRAFGPARLPRPRHGAEQGLRRAEPDRAGGEARDAGHASGLVSPALRVLRHLHSQRHERPGALPSQRPPGRHAPLRGLRHRHRLLHPPRWLRHDWTPVLPGVPALHLLHADDGDSLLLGRRRRDGPFPHLFGLPVRPAGVPVRL